MLSFQILGAPNTLGTMGRSTYCESRLALTTSTTGFRKQYPRKSFGLGAGGEQKSVSFTSAEKRFKATASKRSFYANLPSEINPPMKHFFISDSSSKFGASCLTAGGFLSGKYEKIAMSLTRSFQSHDHSERPISSRLP